MGKIRTRFIGDTDIEAQQKKEQKERSKRKKEQEKHVAESAQVEENVKKEDASEAKELEAEKAQTKKTSQKKRKVHVRGKKYIQAKKLVDSKKVYAVKEAVALLKKMSYASFDQSVELHVNVEKEGLKGEVKLPHSTGKTFRVAIMSDDLLTKIEKGQLDFDVLVSHPSFMPKLAKFARVLGPKGLMPNPKNGTISTDPKKAAEKFTGGNLQWKTEGKAPIVHQVVAKMNAKEDEIVENIQAFINSVGVKKVKSVFVSASMTPSIHMSVE
ncbi:hypothetical protein KC726_02445 [Candidatus Woesebacteria bacterium]|nr:hypothetical protein [Candidatus Woesebacteria bacterium]